MNIDTANKEEMLAEVICNNGLYAYFGGDAKFNEICAMDEEKIRAKLKQWIFESPDC